MCVNPKTKAEWILMMFSASALNTDVQVAWFSLCTCALNTDVYRSRGSVCVLVGYF